MIVPEFKLEWMDPPSPAQAAYEPILRELKARAGKWARVQTNRSTTSGMAMWKKLGCETRHNRINPGEPKARYDIYVRWPEVKSSPEVKPVARPSLPDPRDLQAAPSPEAERFRQQRLARGVPTQGNPI